MSSKHLKITALILGLFPIALLLVLKAAEVAAGNITGVQHLLQIAPLALLVLAAWRWPEAGGIFLTTIGFVMALVYLVLIALPLRLVLVTEAALFLPAIISGCLFVLAARAGTKRVGAVNREVPQHPPAHRPKHSIWYRLPL